MKNMVVLEILEHAAGLGGMGGKMKGLDDEQTAKPRGRWEEWKQSFIP